MKSWKKALGSLLLAGVLLVQTAIPVLAEPTAEAEEDNVLLARSPAATSNRD